MIRRWMTVTLAALLLASSLQPVAGANAPPTPPAPEALFTDLDASHWASTAVERLVKHGVIAHVPDAPFRPGDPLKRSELFKMVLVARKIETNGQCWGIFHDVPCTAWFAPYAEVAFQLTIAEQVDHYRFDPDGLVTREQLANVLIRALGKRWQAHQQTWAEINAHLGPFTDRHQIDYYMRPAMGLAVKEGLIAGFGDSTIRPKAIATRAEAAAVISRIILETEGLKAIEIDGRTVYFRQAMDTVASKYTTDEWDVGTVTYTGLTVRHGVIAVDPKVIPLGSLLYVENYGWAAAVDIGGAIKGNRIDLFSWEPGHVAYLFGYQPRKVWILP